MFNPNNIMRDRVLQQSEDNIDGKKVFIYLKDDDFARYDIEEYLGELISKYGTVKRGVQDLKKIKPLGLFKELEIIKVSNVGYIHKDTLTHLLKNTKDRYYLIEIKESEDLRKLSRVADKLYDSEELKVFDELDYEEELEWLYDRIVGWIGDNKVKRGFITQLKYYLKNNHSFWNDAKLMCEIEPELDEDVMNNYFEDYEYFSIREQVRNIMLGNKKLKTFQVMRYLFDKKGYEPYYIVDKIIEDIEYILEVYHLYDIGVMYGTEIHLMKVENRANKLGVNVSEEILNDKIDMKSVIECVSVVSEEYIREVYGKVIKLYTKYPMKYMIKESDVIQLIEDIRLIKSKEENDIINKSVFKLRKTKKIKVK